MHACCKAGRCQRTRQEIAIVNREPDLVAVPDIEIGMRRQEGLRLVCRRIAETVDIMVTVAFGMGDADECAEREVLLHAKTGLTGQILACYEVFFAARTPFGGTGRVDDRLVDALA